MSSKTHWTLVCTMQTQPLVRQRPQDVRARRMPAGHGEVVDCMKQTGSGPYTVWLALADENYCCFFVGDVIPSVGSQEHLESLRILHDRLGHPGHCVVPLDNICNQSLHRLLQSLSKLMITCQHNSQHNSSGLNAAYTQKPWKTSKWSMIPTPFQRKR